VRALPRRHRAGARPGTSARAGRRGVQHLPRRARGRAPGADERGGGGIELERIAKDVCGLGVLGETKNPIIRERVAGDVLFGADFFNDFDDGTLGVVHATFYWHNSFSAD